MTENCSHSPMTENCFRCLGGNCCLGMSFHRRVLHWNRFLQGDTPRMQVR